MTRHGGHVATTEKPAAYLLSLRANSGTGSCRITAAERRLGTGMEQMRLFLFLDAITTLCNAIRYAMRFTSSFAAKFIATGHVMVSHGLACYGLF